MVRPLSPLRLALLVVPGCADPAEGDFPLTVRRSQAQPTVLDVTWTTEGLGRSWVEYAPLGEPPASTPVETDASEDRAFRLLGLPPGEDVLLRAVSEVDGETRTATARARTGLHEKVPALRLDAWDPSIAGDAPFHLVTVAGQGEDGVAFLLVLDRQARVVWLERFAAGLNATDAVLHEGRILVLLTPMAYGSDEPTLVSLSLLDDAIEEIPLPSAHHAIAPLPDGSLAFLSADLRMWDDGSGQPIPVVGDAVHVRSPDGTIEPFFSMWDWDEPEPGQTWEGTYFGENRDWTHGNNLCVDPDRGTLLLSQRNLSSVLEIDLATGEPLRRLGGADGLPEAEGSTPIEHPHDACWTEDGALLLTTSPSDGETLAVSYDVDDVAGSLAETWSYGQGEGLRSTNNATAREAPGGGHLLSWGTDLVVREIAPDGGTAWAISVRGQLMIGTALPIRSLTELP